MSSQETRRAGMVSCRIRDVLPCAAADRAFKAAALLAELAVRILLKDPAAERMRLAANLGGPMQVSRVLRGVAGTALTWGVAFTVLAPPALLLMLTHVPANEGVLAQVWRWSTEYFPTAFRQGALLGSGYAGALLLLRRRPRSVHDVTYVSVGVIGGLAAVAATVVGKLAGVGVITGPLILLLAVTTSTLSVAIARRAPESRVLQSPDEPRLPAA